MSKFTRVLPADVYDFLELSALAFGGIGAGRFGDTDTAGRTHIAEGTAAPFCVWGHAAAAADLSAGAAAFASIRDNEVATALSDAGIQYEDNDDAVDAILEKKGFYSTQDRVPFKQWAKQLGVVRGDA